MSELYKLPAGWEWKKLDDVCSFVRGPFGGSLKKNEFTSDGYAVYEQSHAIYNSFSDIRYYIDASKFQQMQRFKILPNSIIMSCSGTIGKLSIVPNNIKNGIINQALLMLTVNNSLLNIYLKLMMESSFFQNLLSQNTTGAAIKNIASVKVLKNLDIPLPPLAEQKRIVAKLDNLFEKIDKAIELHQQNITNANILMASTLDKTFKKLEGEYSKQKIESFSKVGTGVTPLKSRKEYYNGSINWITSKTTGYDFVTEAEMLITDFAINECRLKIYPKGTLVVALYGQGKTRGQVTELLIESATNQAVATIVVDKNQNNKHLKFFLKKSYLDLREKASGGTQANLNLSIIKNIGVPLPPLPIQQQTVEYLDSIATKLDKIKHLNEQKLENLKALKASILDKAFRGEL